ncbi:MAG: hypothetical protein HUK09_08965, partial [Bacteroidaceae bacterium]|nr:hypothetical protein [Bacteroidaceae bacterium]
EAMLIFFKKHFPTSSAFLSLPVTAAIYVQAFATLLRQNFLALGRYLWPNRYRMPTTMLYIGPQHTFATLREKSETWGITPTCVEQMPTSLKAAVVAFSAEHHSYESILQQLQQSDHSAHLGIYYPSTECLVMGSNILT